MAYYRTCSFQYISCYGSIENAELELLELTKFQYISCYGSIADKPTGDCQGD